MKEKFLILELTPAGTNGLFLTVDEDRNIAFEKLVQRGDLKKFLKSPARRLSEKTWEGKRLWNGRRRVIVAAEPTLATTIPIPLELPRERANVRTKITLAELENMIAQGMAKIFNATRSEAAKRLAVNDLNAILVGARAKHFKVDGKARAAPTGVAGKKIALLLELTFTTRGIFEELKPFFSAPEGFFFAEAPQAALQALARIRKLPVNMIKGDEHGTALYILERPKGEYAVLYREKLDWAFASFLKAIQEAFAVGDAAAKRLYCRYHQGEMSAHAAWMFRKITEPHLHAFLAMLEKKMVRGETYVDLPQPLPVGLPHKAGRTTLAEHPAEELLAELGFTIDRNAPCARHASEEGKSAVLRPLFYFIEAYFDKDNSADINQKLRRRLHWLAS